MPLPNFEIEKYYQYNTKFINASSFLNQKTEDIVVAGVDESGRGSLIGPVISAAIIMNQSMNIAGINDSKLISATKREELYEYITSTHIWAVGISTIEEIENFNILNATKLACIRSIANLSITPTIALIDGNMQFQDRRFVSIIKGDQKSLSIAAASIIAKVTRDKMMLELDNEFPNYNWKKNKGYGTISHKKAIRSYGLSKYHRRSFCNV